MGLRDTLRGGRGGGFDFKLVNGLRPVTKADGVCLFPAKASNNRVMKHPC
jgi:hypothetical protein